MAILRPVELPDDVRNEPFRQSEISFFDACKSLPNNWTVLYGVTWYIKTRNNSWSEGEADFVIISPDIGIVVVEIKGGRIGRDENGWYSIDRNEEKHIIKDPSLQAANCKHKLLSFLKEDTYFIDKYLPARHMVCFPNVSSKDAVELIELPREMQILSEDLLQLENAISSFAKRNYDDLHPSLSAKDCQKIVDILKPNFDIPNRWSLQAARQNKVIHSLTEEQSYIWELIKGNNRVSLSGPAGSGKTLLALKLAKDITKNGGNVLVLVPSKNLKEYYSASLPENNVKVICFSQITDTSISERFDLIVIDESQDLSDDMWMELYQIFNIENAENLLCLFDANQCLNSHGYGCPIENLLNLRLTKVIRNTKQIADFSTRFYKGDVNASSVGPEGCKIQYTICQQSEDLVKVVKKTINHYVVEEGFEYTNIVVLFGQDQRRKFALGSVADKKYGISFRKLNYALAGSVYKQPIVVAESVYGFRGLESDVVILCDIDHKTKRDLNNICYVGASRARNILHIVGNQETIDNICIM